MRTVISDKTDTAHGRSVGTWKLWRIVEAKYVDVGPMNELEREDVSSSASRAGDAHIGRVHVTQSLCNVARGMQRKVKDKISLEYLHRLILYMSIYPHEIG